MLPPTKIGCHVSIWDHKIMTTRQHHQAMQLSFISRTISKVPHCELPKLGLRKGTDKPHTPSPVKSCAPQPYWFIQKRQIRVKGTLSAQIVPS